MVEGIDGAGKSTMIAELHRLLSGCDIETLVVDKHFAGVPSDQELRNRLAKLKDLVYGSSGDSNRWGDAHWLFALGAWYSLLYRCVIQPALRNNICVILDNSPYKIIARYAVGEEVSADLASRVLSPLLSPDRAVLLRVDPAVALRRKKHVTGLEAGFSDNSDGGFIHYQGLVQAQLESIATAEHWPIVDVTSSTVTEALRDALTVLTSWELGEFNRSSQHH